MCVMAGGGKFGANEVARLSIELELYRKKTTEKFTKIIDYVKMTTDNRKGGSSCVLMNEYK